MAARRCNVPRGTPVAVGLIDAHAGALALMMAEAREVQSTEVLLGRRTRRMVVICGTSICHMACSEAPRYDQDRAGRRVQWCRGCVKAWRASKWLGRGM